MAKDCITTNLFSVQASAFGTKIEPANIFDITL